MKKSASFFRFALPVFLMVGLFVSGASSVVAAPAVHNASAIISPTTATQAQTQTYTYTVTNGATSTAKIGSIEIQLPTGFTTPSSITISSASPSRTWVLGSASGYVNGYNSTTRKIGVKANAAASELDVNEFVTIQVATTAPAVAGSNEWTASPWTNLTFNGTVYTITTSQPTVVVSKANQTITFGSLLGKTYGDLDFGVSATASSLLAVSFSSQTPSVCTVSGSTVHIVSAGSCTVRASQAGDANYNAAPNIDQSFSIAKATPTLSVTNSPQTYSGIGQSATVSGSVSGSPSNILTGGAAAQTNVGTYAVTADFTPTDTTNYNNLSGAAAGNFVINKATAVISFSPYNVTYDGNPHTATATATGVLGEDLLGSLDLSNTTHTNAGDYATDPWTFTGGTNYNDGSGTFEDIISQATSTTTISCPATVEWTGSPLTPCSVLITGAGGLNLNPDPDYLNNTDLGTLTASASYTYAGDANYSGSTDSKTFSIVDTTPPPAPIIDTHPTDPSDSTAFSFDFHDTEAGVSFLCKVDGDPFVACVSPFAGTTAAGSREFDVKAVDPSNNESDVTPFTWTINKATPTLSISNSPVTYNGAAQSATVDGSVSGTVSNVLYDGSATVPTDAGTYAVTADFTPDDALNYNSLTGDSAGNFVIDQATSSTVVSCPVSDAYTGSPLTPCSATVTGTGGLNQSVSVDYLNNTNPGTANASATFAGDLNHSGSSDATTFDITGVIVVTHTITTSTPGGHGSISPAGSVVVNDGNSQAFTIAPNGGYTINDVLVDGVSQGAITTYTFTNVTANHTISASFTAVPPATSVNITAATGGSSILDTTTGGAYTSLTGPTMTEVSVGAFGTGTLVLNSPSGFEFSAAASSVTATVTNGVCSGGANKPVKLGTGAGTSSETVTPTTSSITINVKHSSAGAVGCQGTITYTGINVRPTAVTPLASGNITESGTASFTGNTSNYGTLTEVTSGGVSLSSIAITTPATKLTYNVGDALDISGLVVTGTYSDTSTQIESITTANISGFDSSAPAVGQVLTITFGGKTTTYTVDINAVVLSSVTITSATGGSAISADDVGGIYTSLTGPVMEEGSVGAIGAGTITLNVPSGFEFDTGGTVPTVLLTRTAGSGPDSHNINDLADASTIPVTVSSTQLSITISSPTQGNVKNSLTWQNLRVRPTAALPLATGNITESGTASFTGSTPNYGTLTEVAGAVVTHTLTYTAGANGSITGTSPQTVNQGADGATVTATPESGFHFTSWSDGVLTASRTDTNVQGDITVSASFDANLPSDKNIVDFSFPEGSGVITGTNIAVTVPFGTNVTSLVPTITLSGGTVDPLSGVAQDFTNPVLYTVTAEDASNQVYIVTVTVAPVVTHTLTYNAGANGTISGTSPQTVNNGTDGASVNAVANLGFHFVNWSDASTANPRTDTNVTGDVTVTANFAADVVVVTHTLTYTAGANGSITGTSPQTVNQGADGSPVTAVANSGFHFVNWSDASTSNPRTDTEVSGDITVSANFAADEDSNSTTPPPSVTITSSGGRLGQVLGASTGPAGEVLGAGSFHFTLTLKKGSKGNEVMELQKFLNAAGYDCGTPDGKFGSKTKACVIKFQLANGLKGDGVTGPKTRAVLNK